MQCFYCHALNDDDAPRCSRCGRRVSNSAAPNPSVSNLAFALEHNFETKAEFALKQNAQAAASPAPASVEEETQPWLFRANDLVGRPKVVPIPVLTPRHAPAVRGVTTRNPRRSRNTVSELQHLLDLQDSVESNANAFDAVIDCDAPVAPAPQRVAAAMVDGGLIALGVILFFAIFLLAGGALGLNRTTAVMILGTAFCVAVLYRSLWCLGCGDTPGTRSAGMRVVNFDGRVPDRTERGKRLAAGVLSVLSAGLGLIWVLVDEENLSWHDHISKTFPTPL